MKTGWKREESSIAAVCGGCLTGTQERVTQAASGSGPDKAGEESEKEQEEAGEGEGDHQDGRGGPGPGPRMASLIIIKALVCITGAARADL